MPQVSQRPPPYSRDWSSFPPPIPGDINHRAWAFQLGFENARELVRWTVLMTFKMWEESWALKGQDIARNNIQQAYIQAPEDLKLAVDWQLKWDTPMVMRTDDGRRWHEHVRRQEAGIHEEVLTPEKFEREFDTAFPAVQQAVLSTFSTWKWHHERVEIARPRRDELVATYISSSRQLQAVLCFMLEMAIDVPFLRLQDMVDWEADFKETVEEQRAEAHYWNLEGRADGLW